MADDTDTLEPAALAITDPQLAVLTSIAISQKRVADALFDIASSAHELAHHAEQADAGLQELGGSLDGIRKALKKG
jgi:hypothetical protein